MSKELYKYKYEKYKSKYLALVQDGGAENNDGARNNFSNKNITTDVQFSDKVYSTGEKEIVPINIKNTSKKDIISYIKIEISKATDIDTLKKGILYYITYNEAQINNPNQKLFQ